MYSKEIGKLIVLMITGMTGTYVGEIAQSEPMRIKVEETGPYSYLGDGDFIILEADTELIQKDDEFDTSNFLQQEEKAGRQVATGLKRLNVIDGKLHYIYSSENARKLKERGKS